MISRDLANVFDLSLQRPRRTGPSMDVTGTPAVLADGLCAIYEPTDELIKGEDGRDLQLRAKFWIDPMDNDGDDITVRAHDWLQWTDYRGKLQKQQLILRVSPWYCGAELDHLLLEIG